MSKKKQSQYKIKAKVKIWEVTQEIDFEEVLDSDYHPSNFLFESDAERMVEANMNKKLKPGYQIAVTIIGIERA